MEPRESLNQACAEQKESSQPHTRRLRNGLSVAREVRNESELNITQHYHSSGDERISLYANNTSEGMLLANCLKNG